MELLRFLRTAGKGLAVSRVFEACLLCFGSTTRVVVAWVSKSHGLPGIDLIEQIAKDCADAEHWFLRLPLREDTWQLCILEGRNIPPQGAISYHGGPILGCLFFESISMLRGGLVKYMMKILY